MSWSTPPLLSFTMTPSGSGSPSSTRSSTAVGVLSRAAALANMAVWSASESVQTAMAESPAGAISREPSGRAIEVDNGRDMSIWAPSATSASRCVCTSAANASLSSGRSPAECTSRPSSTAAAPRLTSDDASLSMSSERSRVGMCPSILGVGSRVPRAVVSLNASSRLRATDSNCRRVHIVPVAFRPSPASISASISSAAFPARKRRLPFCSSHSAPTAAPAQINR